MMKGISKEDVLRPVCFSETTVIKTRRAEARILDHSDCAVPASDTNKSDDY